MKGTDAVPAPGPEDVRRAGARLSGLARCTPVHTSGTLDRQLDARLWFKCESFQRGGAFKFRGAANALLSRREHIGPGGVATHSSGNHAAALALAGRLLGVTVTVVMPRTAPGVKRRAVAGYGARIVLCEPTLADREETLARVVEDSGAHVVHPYDDFDVVAGQGTAALELLATVPEIDTLVAPIGGGGLAAGTALAAADHTHPVRLLAAEPLAADDAARSFAAGRVLPPEDPETIADGLRTGLGKIPFAVLGPRLERVLTASEDSIVGAMRRIWERMKLVVEPSAAVALAAMLEHPEAIRGRRVGVILSGGNVDLDALPWTSPREPVDRPPRRGEGSCRASRSAEEPGNDDGRARA